MWQEANKSVLIVTHNVRGSVGVGGRVVGVDAPGRVVADETGGLPRPRGMNYVTLASEAARISSVLQNNGDENGRDGRKEGGP